MKKELIGELFRKFEEACYLYNNLECWSARALQEILGYTEWRNFQKVVEKAKKSCENSDVAIADHLVEVNKMVELGSNVKWKRTCLSEEFREAERRRIRDWEITTRFSMKLPTPDSSRPSVAQNDKKGAVSLARRRSRRTP